ncbi:MAG: hypothetical protein PHO27_08435 [Sulfuricurvum sp.]|nr:hypothetical protein [Sulfuricurvum sp.]
MKKAIWYESAGKKIDLSKVTRIYPAALIHAAGETASVSLEWAAMKEDVIILESYVLICDFDPIGEVPTNRVELRYITKEALFEAMDNIVKMLKN